MEIVLEKAEDLLGEKQEVKLKVKLEPSWGQTWVLGWVDVSFGSVWVEKEGYINSDCIPTYETVMALGGVKMISFNSHQVMW